LFDRQSDVDRDEYTKKIVYECFKPELFRGIVNFMLRRCVNLKELSLSSNDMYLSFIHPTDEIEGIEELKLEKVRFQIYRTDRGGVPFLGNILKKSKRTLRHLELAFKFQGYPADLG
jgi:hypothetical protein